MLPLTHDDDAYHTGYATYHNSVNKTQTHSQSAMCIMDLIEL